MAQPMNEMMESNDDDDDEEIDVRPSKTKQPRPRPATNDPGQQVGGNHYAADFQHWDWVEHNRLGYMEGQITRYVLRWRKKEGVVDLNKAVHYTDKLIEFAKAGRKNRSIALSGQTTTRSEELFKQMETPPIERAICLMVLNWYRISMLEDIKLTIQSLIGGATV